MNPITWLFGDGAPPAITPFFRNSNYAEAALWAAVAVVVLFRSKRQGAPRRPHLLLAATLLAFGGSDVVEANTGAWWHPWWLFVWKATCVVVFLGVLLSLRRAKRTSTSIHAEEPR